MNISKESASKFLIILFHVIGFFGFLIKDLHGFFITLVPFHLMLMTAILLVNFKHHNKLVFYSVAGIGLAGYLIEVLGVHTNLIFGSYSYGNTLGIKILSVPLIMSLNWILMVFAVGGKLRGIFGKHKISRTLIGAFLMVCIDFFIEPVAITFDYWSWENVEVPIHNYIGWFVISIIMMAFYNYFDFKKTNYVGNTLLYCQIIFFIGLNITSV